MSAVAELARQLVAIDSVNPDLTAGGAGEGEIARFVASWCERAGLAVELSEPAPGRANVVARATGRGGGRSLMLNAHLDTVGIGGMTEPFGGRIEGGRLYGRGAYDMKASLAASMIATAEAAQKGLRGEVILAAVADEEVGSIGSEAVAAAVRPDAAIVTEPTELRLAIAHKGFVAIELETAGRAAHGSRPDLGVDAIARMGHVLVRLEDLDRRLRAGPGHPLLGTGSLHASLVEGGQEYSTYPAQCVLKAERRTVPAESVELVEAEARELLGDLDGAVRVEMWRSPFEVDPGAEIVQLVHRCAGGPEIVGVPYWADSALFAAAGVPTVLFGPAGEGAHADDEWVDLESVERCAQIYSAVAAELCA